MPGKYLFAAALCSGFFLCRAAGEVSIDVPDVIERVAKFNSDVRRVQSSFEVSKQGVAIAKAARLPHISASLDLTYIGDGTIIDRDFSNSMRDKLPHFGNTLSISLYQPLFQGGAINAGIDMAQHLSQLSGIGVDQTVDGVSIEALANYFNLLKMRNMRAVYVENIEITRRLIDQMTEHFNQGTALRNDITRYELRLSSLEYDLKSIDNSISVLNTNLASLLGYDVGVSFHPSVNFETQPDIHDEDYWQSLTMSSSSELKAVDKSKDIAAIALRIEKAALFPSVGIVLGDNLSGPVTFEIPAINKNYNAWFAGVSLSYDFSSLWTANKKVRQKQLEIIQAADTRVALQDALHRKVHDAFIAVAQAMQMLDTELVNVRLANENYQVVETRFQNDMALLTDMLDASTAKLDAETRLVNARVGVLLSFYQLKYISGTLRSL